MRLPSRSIKKQVTITARFHFLRISQSGNSPEPHYRVVFRSQLKKRKHVYDKKTCLAL